MLSVLQLLTTGCRYVMRMAKLERWLQAQVVCVLFVCSRRQPCVDHLPFPESPDEFQKEQLGPMWFSSCRDKEANLYFKKHFKQDFTHSKKSSVWMLILGSNGKKEKDLKVSESEDHRLCEVYSVGSFVHRSWDDVRVYHEVLSPGVLDLALALTQSHSQPERWVLRSQEEPQVLIEGKDQVHLTWKETKERRLIW